MIIETCPKCGHDLQHYLYTSNPPVEVWHCLACGWKYEHRTNATTVTRVPFSCPKEGHNENDKLVRLSDVTAALNSEGYTKNMRVHKKVLSIPAVDAVEVRHGYWHTLTDCSNSGTYCSECNTKIFDFTHKPKNKLSRYCAACGARMDGRREDGDA